MSTCSFALRRLQVVEVRRARSHPLGPDSELLALFSESMDCDFWKEPFYVIGSALVLLVRSAFSWLVYGNFDFNPGCNSRTKFHRRERRRCGCCWNVEVSFWVESFDANGGALVLRERCPAECGCCPGVALPGGTGRSLRLRDQYPIGPGRSLRLRDSSPGPSRKLCRPGRSRPVGAGASCMDSCGCFR